MKKLKLIVDSAASNFEGFQFLTENINDKSKPKTYILKGIYAQSNIKNGNKRIYPYEVLKPEIDRFRTEMIETRRALGELEHPSYAEINPSQAAIRITKLEEDNKSWLGESVILASQPEFGIRGTPKGDILLGLVQYGTKMGFSTRCLGDVNDDGIVTDLQMQTIDCVSNPSIGSFCESNGDRFVNGILESKTFVCENHTRLERCYSKLNKKLSKMPNTHVKSKKSEFLGEAITQFFKDVAGI